jgi:ABC-type transporter Mla subunit MlaD
MNSKFKELRKLLQSSPFVPSPEVFSGRDPQVSQTPWVFDQLPSSNSAEPAETSDALTAQSSMQVELLAEQATDNGDGHIAVEGPNAVDQVRQSIGKLFEPAQLCKEHLAEIANASDSINKLVRSAPALFEPFKSFCDHMPRLSKSFASMRMFQDDLGVLAESFEPGKALHQQVIQLANTVRAHLAEVAESLEPVNTLRAQAAELAQILGAGAELQAQFSELAKAIGAAVQSEQ